MKKDIFCKNSIGLLILAGGKSQRMGTDKGTLKMGEETFISRLLKNMGDYDERILSAPIKVEIAGVRVLPDEDSVAGKGPAAGIATALSFCRSKGLMVVPCDAPFADFSVAEKLIEAYCDMPQGMMRPVVAESTRGIEPLIGIYPKCAGPIVRKALEGGIYKMKDILKKTGCRTVFVPDEKLININTPEDYKRYEQK